MKTAQIIRRMNFSEWGGTENVVFNSALALSRMGDEVEILATTALGGKKFERRNGVDIRRFGYCYPYWPMTPGRRRALDKKGGNPFVPGMERYLDGGGFELIHCHNSGRLAELAARVCRRRDIPLVLSMHGGCFDVPQSERDEMLKPLRGTFSWGGALERVFRVRRDVLESASGIICVGENEAEEFHRRFPQKKVCYLPNGVDVARFDRPHTRLWHEKLRIDDDEKLVLNVSRIDYQKNQLMLVDLALALRARGEKAHFLLIGPITSQWYYEKLLNRIFEAGLDGCFTIVPGLPPDSAGLTEAYLESDVFIQCSLHEPFGIVILEAWCAGLPVLAARVGGMARLIDDGRTALGFDPGDTGSLLAAWERLPDCGAAIAAAGRGEAREKYSWGAVSRRLREFYQELLGR